MNLFSKIRAILGKLTDILVAGRSAGLWNEKPGGGAFQDKKKSPFDKE